MILPSGRQGLAGFTNYWAFAGHNSLQRLPAMDAGIEGGRMLARAQLSVTELRRAVRHPVDFSAIGDHRLRGDVELRIVNV